MNKPFNFAKPPTTPLGSKRARAMVATASAIEDSMPSDSDSDSDSDHPVRMLETHLPKMGFTRNTITLSPQPTTQPATPPKRPLSAILKSLSPPRNKIPSPPPALCDVAEDIDDPATQATSPIKQVKTEEVLSRFECMWCNKVSTYTAMYAPLPHGYTGNHGLCSEPCAEKYYYNRFNDLEKIRRDALDVVASVNNNLMKLNDWSIVHAISKEL